MGCYGNAVVKTPHFDHLAQSGYPVSENCHVQFPVCGASRCSMVTGWPTSVRGHRSLYYFLQPDEPNMFRYLRQAGYDVYMFGKNDVLAPRDHRRQPDAMAKPETACRRICGNRQASASDDNAAATPGATGAARSTMQPSSLPVEVLERREQDRPFCILLSLFEPHPPYTISADFYDLYRPSDVPALAPPGLPRRPRFHEAMREISGLTRVSDSEFRKLRSVYYGQVSYSDWLLGELLEAMDRTSRARDTALLVCSDHGDYAGDFGLVEKWPSGLEDCLTRVPLMARIPGGTPVT